MGSPSGVLFAGLCYPIFLLILRRLAVLVRPDPEIRLNPPPAVWSIYAISIVIAAKLANDAVDATSPMTLIAYSCGVATLTFSSFIDARNLKTNL